MHSRCMFLTMLSLKNAKVSKRRGISEIIGSLFMLAIVATFGSIILIQGLQGVNNFNFILGSFSEGLAKSVQENLVVEHVRFDPTNTNKNVSIWIRNTGISDITIDRITMVKIDTQHLIINKDVQPTAPFRIIGLEVKRINVTDSDVTLPSGGTTWSDSVVQNSRYRISITTSTGNSFEAVVKPFNT